MTAHRLPRRTRLRAAGVVAVIGAGLGLLGTSIVGHSAPVGAVAGGAVVSGPTNPVPWYVHIAAVNAGSPTQGWCGGTLLTPEWVLTADHCLQSVADGSGALHTGAAVEIQTGSYSGAPQGSAQTVTVDRAVPASGFDAALLHLRTPLSVTAWVRPIPLAPAGLAVAGRTASLGGRAATYALRTGSTSIFFDPCTTSYTFCTRPAIAEPGDSGGPLVITSASGESDLVGVVNTPAEYVNVTNPAVQGWIRAIVGSALVAPGTAGQWPGTTRSGGTGTTGSLQLQVGPGPTAPGGSAPAGSAPAGSAPGGSAQITPRTAPVIPPAAAPAASAPTAADGYLVATPLAASSSIEQYGWGLAGVADHDARDASGALKYGGWHSAYGTNPQQPQWVTLDLGSPRTVQHVTLLPATYIYNHKFGFPDAFKVQLSNDPTFTTSLTVNSVPGPSDSQFYDFAVAGLPLQFRYVRILATTLGTIGNGQRAMVLQEVLVKAQ